MSTQSPIEQLRWRLQDRMVHAGEWTRIQRQMHSDLNDRAWIDYMRHQAKEKANSQDPLNFDEIQDHTEDWALKNLPADIKAKYLEEISKFIKSQIQP